MQTVVLIAVVATMTALATATVYESTVPYDTTVYTTDTTIYTTGAPEDGKVRTIFIAAVEQIWDYAPFGENICQKTPFTADQPWVTTEGGLIGTRYKKALYRQFSDANFVNEVPRTKAWQHLGVLGPVIHAEVGDEIRVIFKNLLPFPVNMHPDSYFIVDITVSGTPLDPLPVQPGQTIIYR